MHNAKKALNQCCFQEASNIDNIFTIIKVEECQLPLATVVVVIVVIVVVVVVVVGGD